MKMRKWMANITEEQWEWIRSTSKDTDTNGAAVIRTLIDRAMKEKNSGLKQELAQAALRSKLQKLNDQEAKIEAKREELTRKLKSERIAVPV